MGPSVEDARWRIGPFVSMEEARGRRTGDDWPVDPATAFDGDILAFWFRIDYPIAFMQAVLADADSVGAETSLAGLLG